MEEKPTQRGLSKEAWVAVSAVGAALITGMVTLLTHVIPAAQNPSPSAPPAAPIRASAAPGVVTTVTDAIAGNWEGTAQSGDDSTVQVDLKIVEPLCSVSCAA